MHLEIENIQHPQIKNICGEADQQTVRDFITETNRTLPLYKRMSAVEFSTEPLPRTGTGKLLRK